MSKAQNFGTFLAKAEILIDAEFGRNEIPAALGAQLRGTFLGKAKIFFLQFLDDTRIKLFRSFLGKGCAVTHARGRLFDNFRRRDLFLGRAIFLFVVLAKERGLCQFRSAAQKDGMLFAVLFGRLFGRGSFITIVFFRFRIILRSGLCGRSLFSRSTLFRRYSGLFRRSGSLGRRRLLRQSGLLRRSLFRSTLFRGSSGLLRRSGSLGRRRLFRRSGLLRRSLFRSTLFRGCCGLLRRSGSLGRRRLFRRRVGLRGGRLGRGLFRRSGLCGRRLFRSAFHRLDFFRDNSLFDFGLFFRNRFFLGRLFF